jgi:hypothetical protein
MTHEVVSAAITNQSTCEIGPRNVSPLRVQWIDIGAVELILQEGQGVGIKALLSGHFTMRDGACLECKVTHMMCGEYTFKDNISSRLVAALRCGGHDSADKVRGQIIVVIAYEAATGFRSTNIETVGTSLNSRIGFTSTRPYTLDTGRIVSRTRSLEVPMRIYTLGGKVDCNQDC